MEEIMAAIDTFETHVVPMICDIDAGFGNEEATYLLAKKMIEAGACCIQLENQVSDAKQCGHQVRRLNFNSLELKEMPWRLRDSSATMFRNLIRQLFH